MYAKVINTKNYAEILKVPTNATKQQINQRWIKMSKKYHPDFYAKLSPELQRKATVVSQQINVARQELVKRAR